jgi:hypothetical protein
LDDIFTINTRYKFGRKLFGRNGSFIKSIPAVGLVAGELGGLPRSHGHLGEEECDKIERNFATSEKNCPQFYIKF